MRERRRVVKRKEKNGGKIGRNWCEDSTTFRISLEGRRGWREGRREGRREKRRSRGRKGKWGKG